MNRTPRHVGRHRRSVRPPLTLVTIRDRWHDDLWRHLEEPMPFGPKGISRTPADAAELARIDLADRLALVVSAR